MQEYFFHKDQLEKKEPSGMTYDHAMTVEKDKENSTP